MAKGFHQKEGLDYGEIFSPVVKPQTVRLILTLALSKGWKIRQFDFNNAFLNGDLEEEVFMTQPPGFVASDSSLVCRLHRALYGLKQAPRAWFLKLSAALNQFGFSNTKSDSSLFVRITPTSSVYALVYVDDILLTGSDPAEVSSLITSLNKVFTLKDLGEMSFFLGLEAHHLSSGTILLNQTKYITDILRKAGMEQSKSMPTPMVSGLKLSAVGDSPFHDPALYRSIVGSLQYATITRPDISFAVSKISQFMHAPLECHWKAVKRILRYLSGSLHYGLKFHQTSDWRLYAFCDSDWGSDVNDRKSTTGYCVFLGPNLISWSSKKQSAVSRSSTEAEFRSLAAVVADLTWLNTLLSELRVPLTHPPVVYCDNLSAVLLAANPILHTKSKHFELDLYYVRDQVLQRKIHVSHIPGSEQVADILTKAISPSSFLKFRDKLRVSPLESLSLRGAVRDVIR